MERRESGKTEMATGAAQEAQNGIWRSQLRSTLRVLCYCGGKSSRASENSERKSFRLTQRTQSPQRSEEMDFQASLGDLCVMHSFQFLVAASPR
jgi:hypothetical protein